MEKYYATGKRKTAVARVWVWQGEGNININKQTLDEYFGGLEEAKLKILYPLNLVGLNSKIDVYATVKGGGIMAQAEALRHGISKALVEYDPNLRATLKPLGLLSRDARAKERKKYGRKKARKSFQWSKR
ncbi:30S ribosomal protein S9 [Hippea maritima]|uniref:Small ribosomal subunit protein uS9 n=1 Tax=Hippea maritima (strain ATCC 700847 / DSM 10411 / MH2) TaxID=760142 RepID=F2LXK0_HIPMA|nr:30S ribosomal protein S9 [Hippea maritima]AEA33186.1 ribosomal protein S9 [Hippea maritima DSM 10411]